MSLLASRQHEAKWTERRKCIAGMQCDEVRSLLLFTEIERDLLKIDLELATNAAKDLTKQLNVFRGATAAAN